MNWVLNDLVGRAIAPQLLLFVCIIRVTACCDLDDYLIGKQVSVEENTATAQVVFRGLSSAATPTSVDERGAITIYFQLVNSYKGVEALNRWDSDNYRFVNVTFLGRGPTCAAVVTVPQEYIIFCNLIDKELQAISAVKWDENTDERIWTELGWSSWSDWSSCSVSCSTGIQQRSRYCHLNNECPGYNIEQRHCNMFGCPDAVNPLSLEELRYFHPSKDKWQKVPDRPTAWRLKPNLYVWVPSIQLFPTINSGTFPREFTIYITLRIFNDSNMGTIFSLRSRRQQDTYLSLEIAGFDLKLVHASANGTDVVRIPTTLFDKRWHQIAIGIRDDSVIESYLDCKWLRTDILKMNSINIPADSDLIVGYLFSGDLEQLSLVADSTMVSLHCSSLRTPIIDPTVTAGTTSLSSNKPRAPKKYSKTHHKNTL